MSRPIKRKKRARRAGPGRPSVLNQPIRRPITFEHQQWEKINRIAEENGISIPHVIRTIIDEYEYDYDDEEENIA